MAFKLGQGVIEITASGLGTVTRGLGGLRGTLASVGSGLTGLITGLGGIALGGAGFGVLYQGAKKFVDIMSVQEDAQQKLNAVLTATGNATGFTAKELFDYAGELQKTSKFGDEATISAMGFLATSKNIRGDVFKRTTKAAQDMATVMGGSLDSAMRILARTMEDPLRGAMMLRRYNVALTQSQMDNISAALKQGDVQKAQGVILEALEGRYSGAAEAMTKSWSGVATQTANAFGDVLETIGSGLLPAFTAVGSVLVNKVLPWVQTFATTYISLFIQIEKMLWSTFLPTLTSVWNGIVAGFNFVLPYLVMFKNWTVTAFYVALTAAQNWRLSLDIVWEGFLVGLGTAYDGMRWLFLDTMPRILVWVRQNWQDILWDIVNFIGTVTTNIITNLWNWTKGVGDIFVGLGKTIYDVMLNAFEGLSRLWKKLMSGDFSNWGDVISETFNKNMRDMKNNFDGSLKNFTWTPLTQGFQRETAKLELGTMVASEFTKTHRGKLAADVANMVGKVNANMSVKPAVDTDELNSQVQKAGEQGFEIAGSKAGGGGATGGQTVGLADVAKNLQSAAFKMRDPAKIAEDQLDVQQRQADTLDVMAGHLETGNQLTQQMISRVEGMGALQ